MFLAAINAGYKEFWIPNISPLTLWVRIPLRRVVLATGRCFSTNKTDRHDITEILLERRVKHHNSSVSLLAITRIILRPLSLDEGLNAPNGKTASAVVWFRRPIKCQILARMHISDFLYFRVVFSHTLENGRCTLEGGGGGVEKVCSAHSHTYENGWI